jgi:serine protease SohB
MTSEIRSYVEMLTWPFVTQRHPMVPVIRLAGVIGSSPLRGGGLTLSSLEGAIERAFRLKRARAVALAINSPGGSPVQSDLITRRVRLLAAEKGLPVLAFIEDLGASGGYYLACAADEIYANASSVVGSIGVVSAGFGFVEASRRLGIERRLYTAGSQKALLDPFKPEDPQDVARLKSIQADVHDSFKAVVRERRGDRLKGDDEALFEGQIWSGLGALKVGLIDGIGDLHGVLRSRFGDKVRTRTMNAPRPWWRRRGSPFAGADAAELVTAALAALEERALWSRYGL